MLRFPVSDDRRVIVGFGGPGRVKTRSGKGGAESFSQLPSSESSCQHKPTLTSTKSRWKFYTEVGHRSFHTAWTLTGHATAWTCAVSHDRGEAGSATPRSAEAEPRSASRFQDNRLRNSVRTYATCG